VRCPYRFIVLDGVDGAGKSTQLARLAEALRDAGEDVVVTVEPGGTSVGEAVRALLLSPDHPEMTPLTEALLFCASRAQHHPEMTPLTEALLFCASRAQHLTACRSSTRPKGGPMKLLAAWLSERGLAPAAANRPCDPNTLHLGVRIPAHGTRLRDETTLMARDSSARYSRLLHRD